MNRLQSVINLLSTFFYQLFYNLSHLFEIDYFSKILRFEKKKIIFVAKRQKGILYKKNCEPFRPLSTWLEDKPHTQQKNKTHLRSHPKYYSFLVKKI